MVHALQESWRVLISNGHLIDLRPRATNWSLEVLVDGQVMLAGKVDNAPFIPDETAADEAIKQTVHEGWFSLDAQTTFDCASYWDTLEDMLTYYRESDNPPLTISDEVLTTARKLCTMPGQDKKVRIQVRMAVDRYCKSVSDD